jgi:hypothetical protein
LVALATTVALLAGCGGGGDSSSSSTTNAATTPSGGGAAGGGATGGGASAFSAGVYVGQVGSTDASVALVSDGSRLSGAFLCIPQSTSQWIKPSPVANGKAPLIARRGVLLGSAKFAGKSATGKVTAEGTQPYTAKLASGKAGLYRTVSGTANQPGFTETGWIVLPGGGTCGSTSSITSGGGFKSAPAPSTPKGQITNFGNPFPF